MTAPGSVVLPVEPALPGALVLPVELAGSPGVTLTASVAQPTPGPTAPAGDFEDFEVSPGLLGFLPPFLIALACVGLFLSLTGKLRKVNRRQAELDAAEAAAAEARGPGDLEDPDGPRGPDDRPRPTGAP